MSEWLSENFPGRVERTVGGQQLVPGVHRPVKVRPYTQPTGGGKRGGGGGGIGQEEEV
jgi:hypothetical protein